MDVRISPLALQQLTELHEPILSRVNTVIERLHRWPEVSGTKALRGTLKGSFRVRTGGWRIVFQVSGTVLLITRIENRRDVYEE